MLRERLEEKVSKIQPGSWDKVGGDAVTVVKDEGSAATGEGVAVSGRDAQLNVIDEWMRNARKPESKEDLLRRRKLERSRGLIRAISDGVSALGNMIYTTKYAPDMYEQSRGQLSGYEKRLADARAEREREGDRYYNFALKRGELEALRDKESRERDLALKSEARAQELHPSNVSIKVSQALREGHLADKAAHDEEYARLRAENAKESFGLDNENKRKRGVVYDSQAERNRRSGLGGSGGRRYYGSLPDRNGRMVDYYSKADYEAALEESWRGLEKKEEVVTQTENKSSSGHTKGTSTQRTTKEVSSAKKAAQAKEKAAQGDKKKTNVKWK